MQHRFFTQSEEGGGAASFLGGKTAVGPQNYIEDAATRAASLNQKLLLRTWM